MRPFHYYLISTGVGIAIGSIASWQKSSSESILCANSIQPSFPTRTTNIQKWEALGANTLGLVVKSTNAKGKLSHPKRSEFAGVVVSSNLFETLPSNNSERTHIPATSEQIKHPRGITSPLTPAESEERIPNLPKTSSENILLPNYIQALFLSGITNLQKQGTPVAITLDSLVKSTDANGKLSHPERSELARAFVSSTLFETSPSNKFEIAYIGTTFEQKIELPKVTASLLVPAEVERHIPNLQKFSSESILFPNSSQASFLADITNLQERNAPEPQFLGNTQQSQKLSNNAVSLEVKGREENVPRVAQLVQDSPGNLPQQTLADITELDPKPNPLLRPSFPEQVQINRTVPITLQQALQLAGRNNRQLQVAELEVQRSRLAVRESQSALYPTVGIEAGLNRESSAQGQLSVESQQRQFEGQNRQTQQQISCYAAKFNKQRYLYF